MAACLGELWVGSGRQKVHAENEAVTELEVRIKLLGLKLLGLKLLGLKRRGVIPTTSVQAERVSERVCEPNQTVSGKCTPLDARRRL